VTLAIALLLSVAAPRSAPACPTAIEASIGESVGSSADAQGHGGRVVARIDEAAPGRWVAEVAIDIGGRTVHRRFTARSCSTAHRAVDVAIGTAVEAFAIEAGTAARIPTPQGEPEPVQSAAGDAAIIVPPPLVSPPSAAATPPSAESRAAEPAPVTLADPPAIRDEPPRPKLPRPALQAAFGPTIGLILGPLPRVTASFGLSIALLVGRWRAELAGGYALRQRTSTAGRDDAARIQLWTIEARAAFVPRVRIVEFPVHAGVIVGDLVARGVEVDAPDTAHAFWGAALLGAGVMVAPARRVAVGAEVSGLGAFSLPTFTFGRGADEPLVVHRPDRFGMRALVRFEVRLP